MSAMASYFIVIIINKKKTKSVSSVALKIGVSCEMCWSIGTCFMWHMHPQINVKCKMRNKINKFQVVPYKCHNAFATKPLNAHMLHFSSCKHNHHTQKHTHAPGVRVAYVCLRVSSVVAAIKNRQIN